MKSTAWHIINLCIVSKILEKKVAVTQTKGGLHDNVNRTLSGKQTSVVLVICRLLDNFLNAGQEPFCHRLWIEENIIARMWA